MHAESDIPTATETLITLLDGDHLYVIISNKLVGDYIGLIGVLVVPVSESIWACNRLQIWPTGTRFLTGEVIPGVAALKSWTK